MAPNNEVKKSDTDRTDKSEIHIGGNEMKL